MPTRVEQVVKAQGRANRLDSSADALWQIALLLAELVDRDSEEEVN